MRLKNAPQGSNVLERTIGAKPKVRFDSMDAISQKNNLPVMELGAYISERREPARRFLGYPCHDIVIDEFGKLWENLRSER